MNSFELWDIANRNLIAKAIRELVFEQVLSLKELATTFRIKSWEFTGEVGIWGDLRVDPMSIQNSGELSAAQFFIDIQDDLEIDDILLANFLEELHNTLYADLTILKKNSKTTLGELCKLDGEALQAFLHGHPKLILNKGRIGFNENDHRDFAPENQVATKLFWAAIRKSELKLSDASFTPESFGSADQARLKLVFQEQQLALEDYFLMPFHPWQWERFICMQFAGEIANKTIIPLGEMGDLYLPQISLRTMRNASDSKKLDIKLPLTVLNTSAIRGLSSKYATLGTKLTALLEDICAKDPLLKNTQTLAEIGGAFYEHPYFKKVKNAPYRYHEFIGAIWRESSLSKAGTNEKVLLTGSLTHQDLNGKSLLVHLIQRSKKTASEWIKAYAQEVILPLYHLQTTYGIGLVAHGQNVMVKLKDNFPVGLVIKDFQGDLRFSNEKSQSYGEEFKDVEALPPHYLIHDLLTGHFVTLLRYVSAILHDEDIMNEKDFYQIIGNEIRKYEDSNNVSSIISLLRDEFERVLVNKVRFVIGYSDSAARPKPMLGTQLKNPLVGGRNEI